MSGNTTTPARGCLADMAPEELRAWLRDATQTTRHPQVLCSAAPESPPAPSPRQAGLRRSAVLPISGASL